MLHLLSSRQNLYKQVAEGIFMPSYQRVALYILFDSIERDLVQIINQITDFNPNLSSEEEIKARARISNLDNSTYNPKESSDLLYGLDLGTKLDVLMRNKDSLSSAQVNYYVDTNSYLKSAIPIRNAIMHGRPLTIEQYGNGFALAQSLFKTKAFWPELAKSYAEFTEDPAKFGNRSVQFIDEGEPSGVLHNLPTPEYDDTGFLPRPELERGLLKKIKGRWPVVTILGEGGNGKTALALQVLYGLVDSNDHPFDAIIWVSAKTSILTESGIVQINASITEAYDIIEDAASIEPGNGNPEARLRKLMSENSILLVIDNLETVRGHHLDKIAEDVPGSSKILITSRVPMGSDVSIQVSEFSEKESLVYSRRLIDAYNVSSLKNKDNKAILRYLNRLHLKPLLIKWFILGVKSGINPDKIVANPEEALRFCLENVISSSSQEAKMVLIAISSIGRPISQNVLEHVTSSSALEIERAVNELVRFGLIEATRLHTAEEVYNVRGFARAYVVRVIKPSHEVTSKIRANFSKIQGDFEKFLLGQSYNRYRAGQYTVRSPSEMLASRRLSAAVRSASDGDFEASDQILKSLKVSDPTYFEVYRTEGYIAYLQGDPATAIYAYESALELAPQEPQLHFFFACMLMRGVDNELADKHFRIALSLDGDSTPCKREAARNYFITGNFDEAENLLNTIDIDKFRSQKDKVVHTDLVIQTYTRSIAQRTSATDWKGASLKVQDLANFLYACEPSLFDERTVEHILSVSRDLHILISNSPENAKWASDLADWLERKFHGSPEPKIWQGVGSTSKGSLRSGGLQPTFGFLRSDEGIDTFVHRHSTGEACWDWLIKGKRVSYTIEWDEKRNQTRAENIESIN